MKKIIVVAIVALASAAWAGGELPARMVAPPAPVQPKPWLAKVWDGVKGYVNDRVTDVADVGKETVDFAAGVVGQDPAKDNRDGYLGNLGCDLGDVVIATGDAVVGIVGINAKK